MASEKPTIHSSDHGAGGFDPILDRNWITVGTVGVDPGVDDLIDSNSPPFENGCTCVDGDPVQFTAGVGGHLLIRGGFVPSGEDVTMFHVLDRYAPEEDTLVPVVSLTGDAVGSVEIKRDRSVVFKRWLTTTDSEIPGGSVGTFGDSTHVPVITVDTSGRVINVTEVAITGSSVSDLDDLTDVIITSAAAADRLRFDGTDWRNSPLIWRPAMTFDGTNWMVTVTGSGDAVMTEA